MHSTRAYGLTDFDMGKGKGDYLGLQKKRMGVKPHTTSYFLTAGIGGNNWEG